VVHGASILRVHDVAAHVQALRVWHAIADVRPTSK
jgi:dihydropteroate synthase